jgi:hypothetical protein
MKPEDLTLADRLQELTFHPYQQFGVTIGLKQNAKAYNHMQMNMLGLRMVLRNAKRFVLDDAFVENACVRASEQPDIIAKYSQLAYLPFPVVWLEYSGTVRNQIQAKMGSMGDEPPTNIGRRGFLLNRERASTEHPAWAASFVGTQDNGNAWIAPVQYRLRCPIDRRDKYTLETSYALGAYSWGYTADGPDGKRAAAIDSRLNNLVTIEPDPYFITPYAFVLKKILPELIHSNVIEGRGDMRWLVTVLQMINHVPVSYHHAPTIGSRTVKLKTMPLLDFSTLQIVAGAPRRIYLPDDQSSSPTGIRHKQHDVRGFNRVLHRGTARERTTWVREHKRGDPLLGVVTHDYEVVR